MNTLDFQDNPLRNRHAKEVNRAKVALRSMLACLGAFLFFALPVHAADTTWFTVMGDGEDPAVNTVQVDPIPSSVDKDVRIMTVRVNRSATRTSWDNVQYRSYVASVVFDCANNTARYVSLKFYLQPAWKGESHKTTIPLPETPRSMEFRQIDPNPTARIIRAACTVGKS